MCGKSVHPPSGGWSVAWMHVQVLFTVLRCFASTSQIAGFCASTGLAVHHWKTEIPTHRNCNDSQIPGFFILGRFLKWGGTPCILRCSKIFHDQPFTLWQPHLWKPCPRPSLVHGDQRLRTAQLRCCRRRHLNRMLSWLQGRQLRPQTCRSYNDSVQCNLSKACRYSQ